MACSLLRRVGRELDILDGEEVFGGGDHGKQDICSGVTIDAPEVAPLLYKSIELS